MYTNLFCVSDNNDSDMVVSIVFIGDSGLYRKDMLLSSDLLRLFDKAICKDIFIKVRATELKRNIKDKFVKYELK